MQLRQEYLQQCTFGTAGIKVLSSQDAKKVYTNCTVSKFFVLRRCVMERQLQQFRRNAGDIYAEAKAINEEKRSSRRSCRMIQ